MAGRGEEGGAGCCRLAAAVASRERWERERERAHESEREGDGEREGGWIGSHIRTNFCRFLFTDGVLFFIRCFFLARSNRSARPAVG